MLHGLDTETCEALEMERERLAIISIVDEYRIDLLDFLSYETD
jgi:hypothetical protein